MKHLKCHLISVFLICMLTANCFPYQVGATEVSEPFYEIRAAFDPKAGSVDVNLNLNAPVHLLENGSLSFLFSSEAEVNSISGANLKDYQVEEAGPGLSLYHLQFDTPAGGSVAVDMDYSLGIPNDHQVNRISNDWIELNIDSFWHPVLTSFTRFHYRLMMDLDENYQIISGDSIQSATEDPFTRTIRSIFPRIDISFSASGNFYSKEGKYSRVFSTNESTDLDSLLLLSEQALAFLQDYIDVREDFTDTRIVVESPRKEVGYARENYIMLSRLDELDPVQLSGFLAHEFSHYWFLHGNPQGPDHWLNESFAEYISMLQTREVYGEHLYQKDLRDKRERAKEESNTLASFEERPSHIALYYTGPVILHQFEEYLGKEQFRKLIQQMIDSKISTTEELLVLIRNQFGPEAERKLIDLRNSAIQ